MQALAQQPPSDGRSRTTPTTILMVDYHRTFVDLLAPALDLRGCCAFGCAPGIRTTV